MEGQRKQQIYRNLMVAISNNKKYSTQNFVCYQVSNLFLFYQNFCLNVSYFLVFEKFSFFFSWIVPIYSGKIELLPSNILFWYSKIEFELATCLTHLFWTISSIPNKNLHQFYIFTMLDIDARETYPQRKQQQ